MDVHLKPGKYVVAVSGGVDSMVLLDVLRQKPGVQLIVAHYNHGIRQDSYVDQQLVADTAKRHGLLFEAVEGHLGPQASEAFAREQRYAFLQSVRQKYDAQAIVTAHHQDDVIETMLLALLRGTGRKGLSSLRSTTDTVRPLLAYTKSQIVTYATVHNVLWHEDSTNAGDLYKRNYIRHAVVPRLTAAKCQRLLDIYTTMLKVNDAIDTELADVHSQIAQNGAVERGAFIMLPHTIAREYVAYLLRLHQARDMNAKTVERIVTAIKTARPGTIFDIDKTMIMEISRKNAKIVTRDARNTSV